MRIVGFFVGLLTSLLVATGLAATAAADTGYPGPQPDLIAYTASEMTFGGTTELYGVLTVPDDRGAIDVGQLAARVPFGWDWEYTGTPPGVVEPGETVVLPFAITAPADGTDGPVEVGVDVLYYRDSGKFSVADYTEIYVYQP